MALGRLQPGAPPVDGDLDRAPDRSRRGARLAPGRGRLAVLQQRELHMTDLRWQVLQGATIITKATAFARSVRGGAQEGEPR